MEEDCQGCRLFADRGFFLDHGSASSLALRFGMNHSQGNSLGSRYVRFVQSLPTVCPPLAPVIVAALTIGVLLAVHVLWPALVVGVLLLALAPQWDSCVFGLMDFVACIALLGVWAFGLLRVVQGVVS
jgi:hypothetical protein